MECHDLTHFLGRGKGDVVAEAAAQEGIGQLPFGIGGDDDDRRVFGADGLIDLADHELVLFQHVQQVVLHIRFGLVDLVQQQHHPGIGTKGATDGTPDHVVEEGAHIAAALAGPEAGIVQAQHRVLHIAGLLALDGRLGAQHLQLQTQGPRDLEGQLGLAGAGLTGQQQGFLHGNRHVHDRGQLLGQIVLFASLEFHKRLPRKVESGDYSSPPAGRGNRHGCRSVVGAADFLVPLPIPFSLSEGRYVSAGGFSRLVPR